VPWTADPLAGRRAERERLIALARAYVERLADVVPVGAAAVAGSVARGDFNVWSDIDVVVVSDALPEAGPARAEALALGEAPGVEPHGYTRAELRRALERGDPLVLEAVERGVPLRGELADG
jgi:predicted nucleotidyltransferase